MSKGIVILALGSPYYGSWALNLAMGLRKTQPDCNITLIYSGDARNYIAQYSSVFDQQIEIPKECITRNGFESFIRAKVCLYDLTPYDETIYIDADVMWFPYKSVHQLFDELKDVDITIGNRGECNLNTDPRLIWSNLDSMRAELGTDTVIYNLSSEFIYFKKNEKIKLFFEEAKSRFDSPGVEYVRFAGSVPDELAFQIAMIKTGIKPHKVPYLPFYWEAYEKKNAQLSELYKQDWYGYSIGGNTLSTQQVLAYNTLAQAYAPDFGLKWPMLCKSKSELFIDRKTI